MISSCLYLPDVVAEETDDKMVEFAIGGLCNCCLGKTHSQQTVDLKLMMIQLCGFINSSDKLNKKYILDNDGVELTVQCLTKSALSLANSCVCMIFLIFVVQTRRLFCLLSQR